MSDRMDILSELENSIDNFNPEIKCVRCGDILKIFSGGDFVIFECPKCGYVSRYTTSDYNALLKLKKKNEEREKEREKHYER